MRPLRLEDRFDRWTVAPEAHYRPAFASGFGVGTVRDETEKEPGKTLDFTVIGSRKCEHGQWCALERARDERVARVAGLRVHCPRMSMHSRMRAPAASRCGPSPYFRYSFDLT